MGKPLEFLKETMTREILYPLWDSGLKVGHASRDVKEAISEAQNDIRNKNSMLDARYLCGDRKVAVKFISRFLKFCRNNQPAKYLDELHRHQEERRTEKGMPFSASPGRKNGVGGLRDYQGILWMAKVKFGDKGLSDLVSRKYLSPQEAKSFEDAYSFFVTSSQRTAFPEQTPRRHPAFGKTT